MRITASLSDERQHLHEMFGFLLLAGAVVALLALLSYNGSDGSLFGRPSASAATQNWIGRAGANLAELLLQSLGVAAFLFPLLLGLLGWNQVRRFPWPSYPRLIAFGAMLLSLTALLDLLFGDIGLRGSAFYAGGYIGWKVAGAGRALLNPFGALVIYSTVLAATVFLTTRISFLHSLEVAGEGLARLGRFLHGEYQRLREVRREAARKRSAVQRPLAPEAARPMPGAKLSIALPTPPSAGAATEPATEPAVEAPPGTLPPVLTPGAKRSFEPQQRPLPMEPGKRGYSLPPLDLLREADPQTIESEQELLDRANQIADKLKEFSMGGSVVAIHPGPVVTTFEFKPDAGVKYSKITSMNDDLSLAMKAESVRIARMPGRSTVGIEIPNRKQEVIYPSELLASRRFRASRSKLNLALGKDVTGEVYTAELDRMPHLLIAGATGAGKSVSLNNMIVSLLYKATPADLRFIMIDTKMIELGIYDGIPHLLIPVVTDPKHASAALKWAVREMEQRYRKLAAVGVRNLAQFNELLVKEPDRTMDDPNGDEPISLEKLPYIVVVIDEMADLMMVTAADVEESIMRLAQMARAVGIHLILATQRPSVDVITGTIKANFPSRIAFRVSQRVDSRTIIDQQGAENLLGRGDMLYLASGAARLVRLHGGFITEAELHRVCAYLKKMSEPDYDESVLSENAEGPGGEAEGERDEMYVDAVRTVIQEGKCSITLIQRRLQLGYARAARIVDMMERAGIVGPGEGSKPREILAGPEILEEL